MILRNEDAKRVVEWIEASSFTSAASITLEVPKGTIHVTHQQYGRIHVKWKGDEEFYPNLEVFRFHNKV